MFVKINYKFPMICSLHNALNKGKFCKSLNDYNFVMVNEDDYGGQCIGFVDSNLYEEDDFDIIYNFDTENVVFVWSLFNCQKKYHGVNIFKFNKVLIPKQIYEHPNFKQSVKRTLNVVKY